MILLKKLIKNFHLSEKLMLNEDSPNKSAHWLEFSKSKFVNEKNVINFRKSGLSYGLDDQDQTTFGFLNKIKNIVGDDFLHKNILKKNIGNSEKVFKFSNSYIDFNQLVFIYWFNVIKKYISKKKIKVICEIGGGFGQFSELILNNVNSKLISIDIPMSNLLTSYYLKKNFPKKKFYLFENYNKKKIVTKKDLKKYDIFILPPNCNFEKNIKIDFFINMRSMMEMNKLTIKSYFNFIQTHASKNSYFFCLNRFHKKIGTEIISFENYNYDKNWDVISSGKSFNQKWIYYVLAQRKFKNFKKNIKTEQEKIKELGKEFKVETNFFILKFKFLIRLLAIVFIKFLVIIFGIGLVKKASNKLHSIIK